MNLPRHSAGVFALLVMLPVLAGRLLGAADGAGEQAMIVEVDGGRLEVQPLLENAVRVRYVRGREPDEPSLILTAQATRPQFRVEQSETRITLLLPALRVVADRRSGTLSFLGADGRLLLQEAVGGRRMEPALVQGESCWTVAQRFLSPPGEHLYGTGQFQDGFLNIRDLPRRLTQVNTQISIPIIVSSNGYGVLWHNYGLTELNPADLPIPLAESAGAGREASVAVTTTEGTRNEQRRDRLFCGRFTVGTAGRQAFFLDVGRKMARQWHVQIDGRDAVNVSNVWLPPTTSWFSELEPGEHEVRIHGVQGDQPVLSFRESRDLTEFRSPVATAVDYVFIAGQGDEITAAYRRLTGAAPLPPLWALGYIHCRERYSSQEELLRNAAEFRARRLPLDVIVQDWQYWGRHGWNAMRFDEQHYPDAAAMVRTLHSQDTRLMLSVWSKVDSKSELGGRFSEGGFYIPGTEWVDFFNPAAARFYWEQFRDRLLPLGIDAWWLDATEPENDDLVGRRVHGGPGERVRNIYPLLVNRTVYEGLRRDDPNRRPFILTRCAFAGQQRYGMATWSGDIGNDWGTLSRQVAAGLNYSVTGLPWWTTDTGGFFRPGAGQFQDASYHERFLRWLQYSTFTPLLRVHGYQTDTEPWRYGARVEEESRRWLMLRMRLLPYLYSEAARVCFSGATLMRPLVMDFPSDVRALEQEHEYMFGPAFLVAPVLEPGVKEWPVYLPKTRGGWYDFWTGERHAGGVAIRSPAPLQRIPLLVRAGAIIPFGPERQHSGEKVADPLELRIYAGADADYTLYEDSGVDHAYETGVCARIPMHWDEGRQRLTIGERSGSFPGMLEQRRFRVVLVRPGRGTGPEASPEVDVELDYSGAELVAVLAAADGVR